MGAAGSARTIPNGLGAASKRANAEGLACPAPYAIRAKQRSGWISVFPEFITVEFERVMVAAFGNLPTREHTE